RHLQAGPHRRHRPVRVDRPGAPGRSLGPALGHHPAAGRGPRGPGHDLAAHPGPAHALHGAVAQRQGRHRRRRRGAGRVLRGHVRRVTAAPATTTTTTTTMPAIAYRGRLPGVYCDPALPRRADDAIRLDVAAFVGFTERGPVDDPQLVEDPAQYATLFGDDLPLAIDDKGVPTYAALPDAVRSFFDNGGRRCHVVRVAGTGVLHVDDVPVRVTSRPPLGDGSAVVGLAAAPGPLPLELPSAPPGLALRAASPGGWARRLAVDVEVVDTVLALVTGADGSVGLT